jgi:hypothetical protein
MSLFSPPLTGSPEVPVNLPPDRQVGSLWRRIVAFVIDSIVVGIAGTLIALPFFDFLLTPRSLGTTCGILPYCSLFGAVEQPDWQGANTGETCDASPSGQCQWRADFRVEVVHKIPRAQCPILPQRAHATDYPYASDCDVPSGRWFLDWVQLPSTLSCSTAELDKVFMIWRRGAMLRMQTSRGLWSSTRFVRGHWPVLGALIVVAVIGNKGCGIKAYEACRFPSHVVGRTCG